MELQYKCDTPSLLLFHFDAQTNFPSRNFAVPSASRRSSIEHRS